PVGVLLLARRFFGDNGVLKTGFFESRLPLFNSAFYKRHPLGRSRRIDVIDDRFYRLGYRRAGVFLFESPTSDVLALGRSMLVLSVVGLAHDKITYALIEQARHHRLLRHFDYVVC